ncbi:hypothetical protein GC105_06560 [Alkalibaculum sp. M08DMB]|uniref:Flavodoxin-like domain-containing protein n=1 Tax=Alkalibaculum sporogenes TaxID=2655001 RepID=A0A6A7K7S2_9FIRM|nr:hypothetical protein [Alkalibaculum sporogenes]MPW25445.1 hypothetical protein [Alkalibaculum sporogenes]
MGKIKMKKWKKACIIVIICILVIGLGSLGGMMYVTSAQSVEHSSNEIVLPSDENGKTALVIYQPGRSEFAKNISDSIAKGLNDSGYEVTIDYPGEYLPTDIGQYDIVAFGTTAYYGEFSPILGNYMSEIKNIDNSTLLIYSTGMIKDNFTELEGLNKLLHREADYLEKFISNEEESEIKRAYTLGSELGNF